MGCFTYLICNSKLCLPHLLGPYVDRALRGTLLWAAALLDRADSLGFVLS